jgi:hypothetical protein
MLRLWHTQILQIGEYERLIAGRGIWRNSPGVCHVDVWASVPHTLAERLGLRVVAANCRSYPAGAVHDSVRFGLLLSFKAFDYFTPRPHRHQSQELRGYFVERRV